jgi:hypothetical protein
MVYVYVQVRTCFPAHTYSLSMIVSHVFVTFLDIFERGMIFQHNSMTEKLEKSSRNNHGVQ